MSPKTPCSSKTFVQDHRRIIRGHDEPDISPAPHLLACALQRSAYVGDLCISKQGLQGIQRQEHPHCSSQSWPSWLPVQHSQDMFGSRAIVL